MTVSERHYRVTVKSMRPASHERVCFYCGEPIGGYHKNECVLIKKKAKIRVSVEYEIQVPACWSAEELEHHRNHGTWCGSNILTELDTLDKENNSCLCHCVRTECLDLGEGSWLDED